MSSENPRQRRKRNYRLRTRNPSVEVIEADNPERRPNLRATSTCIDLTCEDDDIMVTNATPQPVVDLTSVNDSPIVILGTSESPPRRRRRNHTSDPVRDSDSDDEDLLEVPPIPFINKLLGGKGGGSDPDRSSPSADYSAYTSRRRDLGGSVNQSRLRPVLPKQSPSHPRPASTRSGQSTPTSTADQVVTCPVCLDNSDEIRASGRQIFSTFCGHIFCNQCINDAIRSQKRCPSCRKKLTLRQVHPIFF